MQIGALYTRVCGTHTHVCVCIQSIYSHALYFPIEFDFTHTHTDQYYRYAVSLLAALLHIHACTTHTSFHTHTHINTLQMRSLAPRCAIPYTFSALADPNRAPTIQLKVGSSGVASHTHLKCDHGEPLFDWADVCK